MLGNVAVNSNCGAAALEGLFICFGTYIRFGTYEMKNATEIMRIRSYMFRYIYSFGGFFKNARECSS